MNERIVRVSNELINNAPNIFKRYLLDEIDWDYRLIGVSGARGSGKTILLLQEMKRLAKDKNNILYVSLDDIHFTNNTLIDFADDFYRNGGKYLFLDEVHKYANWSQEIKNIYDTIPNLKIVFTSSSALEIHKGSHDLSRRAIVYDLPGLSFREYVEFNYKIKLPKLSLGDILNISTFDLGDIHSKIKILPTFKEYLEYGYYPFFKDVKKRYLKQLSTTVNLVIEVDLPAIHKIDFNSVIKLKKLLSIISTIVPYTPNIESLAKEVETTRPTLLKYLHFLDKAQIIKILNKEGKGLNTMTKPDKLYLNNTNLSNAFGEENVNVGTIRETFFLNQLSVLHEVNFPKNKGDFIVDGKYTFEVGGKSKTRKQIIDIENSYIVSDNIDYRVENKIPIWLFGLMY
jgi:predicted AAA+ superfamily ATPase